MELVSIGSIHLVSTKLAAGHNEVAFQAAGELAI